MTEQVNMRVVLCIPAYDNSGAIAPNGTTRNRKGAGPVASRPSPFPMNSEGQEKRERFDPLLVIDTLVFIRADHCIDKVDENNRAQNVK